MNKQKTRCFIKKLTAGLLAVGMLVAGIVVVTTQTDASVVADEVLYEEIDETTIANNYWNATSKTAPVKEGYVFGGWFEKVDTATTNTETDASGKSYYAPLTEVSGKAYAKYVPAQVLSVKAQNQAGTGDTVTDNTHVRIISSLDSKNYKKVGFDIWLANSVQLFKNDVDGEPLETNKIYDGLLVGTEKKEVHATEIFGGVSKYVSVWQLNNIASAHWGKIIYVRPYWITMDGTKVEGLAKYVHVEDDYEGYISVPVNLLGGEKVAAGAVTMTYSNSDNTTLELIGFEAGRILPAMNYSYTDSTVKMVGNTDQKVGEYNADETLYANIRFKKPTVTTGFEIKDGEFCDWTEQAVDVKKAWDTEYVKETTSE